MNSEEMKQKIKDIITNHIRSSDDPAAAEQVTADIHDVLTAKMRDKVLGRTEEKSEVVENDPDVE